MKKTMLMAFAAGALLIGTMGACKKSNDKLIDRYEKLVNEMVEALSDGDSEKMMKLQEEAAELGKDLDKANLSEEDQKRLEEITLKASEKL